MTRATTRHKVDQVEREILRMIDVGELPPGTVIQQRDLATQLAVSPTPVREAFRRLEMAGVLQANANGGVRVADNIATSDDAARQVRAALEHLGVDLLMQRVTRQDIATLRSLNEQYREGAVETADDAHWHLHLSLFQIAQTPILTNHLRVLWSLLEAQSSRRRSRAAAADHHAQIIDAIDTGDADLVKRLLDEHHSYKPPRDA